MEILSAKLIELRQNNNLTQKQLSEKLEISERNYQRLEANPNNPKIETIQKIADFYNISVDFLLGRTDNPEINK